MTPIIFLDIDGVINTPFIHNKTPKSCSSSDGIVSNFQAIKLLNWIYSEHKFDIVITSTWRLGTSLSSLQGILIHSGLNPKIKVLGFTPDLRSTLKYDKHIKLPFNKHIFIHTRRGHEIDEWIKSNNYEGDFIILDDDSDMWKYKNKLIQLNSTDGLTMSKALEVLSRLSKM